jgi:hypothetical protein
MIKGLMFLASYGTVTNGWLGDLFVQWEQIGLFSYLLPFLLIFALIFGILTKVKLFKENKAINAIIALVMGIMAIQFEFVPTLFSELLPRVGIALVFILSILIVIGIFSDPDHPTINWILLGIAAIILIIVIVQTAGAMGWSTGYWWQENWLTILGAVIVIALIIAIIASSSSKKPNIPFHPIWGRDFAGGK